MVNERVNQRDDKQDQVRIYLQEINLDSLKKDDITEKVKNFAVTLGKSNFKSNQMRKYYNEILALKNKYETKKEEEINKTIELDIAIFLSKIEYGKNKAKKDEKDAFDLYQKNIEAIANNIKNYNQFKNFVTIMESIVAYYSEQQ